MLAMHDGRGSVTVVRPGAAADYSYVESLRRKEQDALGFIPKDRYLSILERRTSGGRKRYEQEQIVMAADDGEPTGFAYASRGSGFNPARIYQLCVQEDARRWQRASSLVRSVEEEALRRGADSVVAGVAADLEANAFWRAMGYVPAAERAGMRAGRISTSGRIIVVYRKDLLGAPQLRLPLPDAAKGGAS